MCVYGNLKLYFTLKVLNIFDLIKSFNPLLHEWNIWLLYTNKERFQILLVQWLSNKTLFLRIDVMSMYFYELYFQQYHEHHNDTTVFVLRTQCAKKNIKMTLSSIWDEFVLINNIISWSSTQANKINYNNSKKKKYLKNENRLVCLFILFIRS